MSELPILNRHHDHLFEHKLFRCKRGQPAFTAECGLLIWQRPTLAGPVVRLPLALRRFTSVFGMGTGGSTALWSPEAERGKLMVDRLMVDRPCNRQTRTASGLAMVALGVAVEETGIVKERRRGRLEGEWPGSAGLAVKLVPSTINQ